MDNNYTKVFEGNFIIVGLVKERLKEVGINAILKDESESGRLAGFMSPIQGYQELYVQKDEVDKSRSIIETVKNDIEEKQS